MNIKVIKKINENDPDYNAIGEPYYYHVQIDGAKGATIYDYYPPDTDRLAFDSEINLGVLPKLYGRLGNDKYYSILEQVKKAVDHWELKQRLSPQTRETFGDLIDEL